MWITFHYIMGMLKVIQVEDVTRHDYRCKKPLNDIKYQHIVSVGRQQPDKTTLSISLFRVPTIRVWMLTSTGFFIFPLTSFLIPSVDIKYWQDSIRFKIYCLH